MHGAQGSEMAAKMISTTADMPMPDDCDDCGGDDGMDPAACTAICASSAPAILPIKAVIIAQGRAGRTTFARSAPSGSSGPPEPYPPRLSIIT